MPTRDWNERYVRGDTPWDMSSPDPHLVELVGSRRVRPGRVLEIGCGTGTDSLWLAEQGFDVLGVDLSPRAIEMANEKRTNASGCCRFAVLDFLADDVPAQPFDFVFDRGVFHAFDDANVRAAFASRVADCLAEGGQWMSLSGSTEGPPRDHGPPRRSARDIMQAIEPALEIVELRSTHFDAKIPSLARAWLCFARKRELPAQPSTGA